MDYSTQQFSIVIHIIQRYLMNKQKVNKINNDIHWHNNNTDFQLNKPIHLIGLFKDLALDGDVDKSSIKLAAEMEREISSWHNKTVFTTLKWLLLVHQLFQQAKTQSLMQRYISMLRKMPIPCFNSNYEKYIYKKLVLVYKQYILKLATAFQTRLQGPSPSKKSSRAKDFNFYYEYNLLGYALQEFTVPINQFSRFFQWYYPCLNQYSYLITKDLEHFYKRIRLNYEQGNIQEITYIEIEKLGTSLLHFTISSNRSAGHWIFPPTDTHSLQLWQDSEQFMTTSDELKLGFKGKNIK